MSKKPVIACFAAAFLSCQLTMFSRAAGADLGAAALSSAGRSMGQFASSLLGVIIGFPKRLVSWCDAMGIEAVAWITLILIAMTVALLGFRVRKCLSVGLGGGLCFALGYTIYITALSLDGTPNWITSNASVLIWVVSGVLCVAGGVLFWYLRRFGMCLLVGLIVGGSLYHITGWHWLALAGGMLACLICSVALKEMIVYLTSLGGSMWAVYLLIGPGGVFSLSTYEWQLLLLLGLLLGLICTVVQNTTSHSRKYY